MKRIDRDSDRRRSLRIIAIFFIGQSILASTVLRVLPPQAPAAGTQSQVVRGGSLVIALEPNGAGLAEVADEMAPGDITDRFITLANRGNLPGQDLSLQVLGGGSPILLSDTPSSQALRIALARCSQAWDPDTGVCPGSSKEVLSMTEIEDLRDGRIFYTGNVLMVGEMHLRIRLMVPHQTELTINGSPPQLSIQGQTARLTYIFRIVQS